nr:hypothetical protein [Sahlingia subintegra]
MLYSSYKSRFVNNLDLLMLTMEILDSEFIDDFFQSLQLNSENILDKNNTLFLFISLRFSNVMRSTCKFDVFTIRDLFIVVYTVFKLFSSKHWLILLKSLFASREHFDKENSLLENFFRKYRFHYKKKMHKYRVGKIYYENDDILNSIALSYAYLLYLIVKKKDFYFFIDCLYNFSCIIK